MRILCFGSLNIDYTYQVDHFVAKGETLASTSLRQFAGGKGLNQSVALSRAGAEVYHAGAIGGDGGFLLEMLRQSGVDTRHVEVLSQTRTGHAIIQNDASGDNCILLYGGANQNISPTRMDAVLSHFGEGDVLLLQNEINGLAHLMRQAHKQGMKIALNPSPMEKSVLRLPLQLVDLFLLNEVEAQQVAQAEGTGSQEDILSLLRKKYPKAAVVLTLGSRGAIYEDGEVRIDQRAYQVQTVDTTAAGDTFTGYFLGSRMRGESVEAAMELASRAAAISVTRRGAAPSIPWLTEVEKKVFKD